MLTDERVDAIFSEMDAYTLELVSDPSSLGPRYFQEVISVCRNYLNRVGLVLTEINREKLEVSSELRKLEAAYALEHDDLLANNERVRFLASVEDRKATVGWMLREQRKKINELKDQMHQLDAVHKVVNYRNKELHATMTAIKDQRRLIQIEVDTGSFYGDERTGERRPKEAPGMAVDDLNEEELAAMLDEDSDEEEEPVEGAKPDEDSDEEEEPVEEAKPEPVEPKDEEVKPEPVPEEPKDEQAKPEPVPEEPKEGVSEADVVQFLESSDEPLPQPVVDQVPADTTTTAEAQEVEDVLSLLEEL